LRAIKARRDGKRANVRWLKADGTFGDAVLEAHPPGVIFDTIGLALSGGGVRSAATCLGALQALAADEKLRYIDYLSTVLIIFPQY
jgi:predicted acylesterase/phospholipase RssA